jgi:hypothetical protein
LIARGSTFGDAFFFRDAEKIEAERCIDTKILDESSLSDWPLDLDVIDITGQLFGFAVVSHCKKQTRSAIFGFC